MIRDRFLDLLAQEIPFKTRSELDAIVAPDLVSPFHITLPKSVLRQAQEAVSAFFAWRSHPDSIQDFTSQAALLGLKDPGNKAICMSYDFHLTPQNELKLIEVNTNAAFLGLSWPMYQAKALEWPIKDFNLLELKKNIEEEIGLAEPLSKGQSWVILDEKPFEQKLRVEFDFFLSLFRKWGIDARICDLNDVTEKDRFVYNRYTDFFLSEEKSKNLRDLYLSKTTCFSPHPFEYLALADKSRMLEMSLNPDIYRQRLPTAQAETISKVLLECDELTSANSEELWTKRRTRFFKPLRAFGGKQSYRGLSISRKVFAELIDQSILAQEWVPAPEVQFETPQGQQNFKYDLRFYAYKGRVQGVAARIYQGQLTNLKTPYGGFACVQFDK